ncbi:hemerythrin domain-containing protein [Actinocorallia longicatena]|uniref:Hemerythrin domain-containing protein n=1 Tax=Actinocorallia longicatena TaxID=111803 RepID=A0ABP6QJY4_9ACTN
MSPRRAGDPEIDLTAMSVIHRAMREDVRRLAALTAAQGDRPFPAAREAALAAHLEGLAREIHSHHGKEDDVLWPVISASAGAAIDLKPLSEDHTEIDPILDRIRTGSGTARAQALAELRDLLDDHIAEEEAVLFPIMRAYVSVADFEACEKRFREGAPMSQLKWVVPWLAGAADEEESARMLKAAGLPFRILLALTRPGHLKRQRLIFG